MAIWNVFTEKQEEAWQQWVNEIPEPIKELCKLYPPNKLFELKTTGQKVYVVQYDESLENNEHTLTVGIDVVFNKGKMFFDRNVFGIKANDLVECDLPPGYLPLNGKGNEYL